MSARAVVVCDASPLIFLAKLGRLDLISAVLGGEVVVLRCVVEEVFPDDLPPVEKARLEHFFDACQVVDFDAEVAPSAALSLSDRSTLAWCTNNHPQWLVADERLLRRCAVDIGIQVIGFLGITVGAYRRKDLTKQEARDLVDSAIQDHGCRISTALYAEILRKLGG